jgi:methionyl-tRNA synthetase
MKDIITFEDFQKLDIRVGTIIQADLVPKSKKLLRLAVDFGDELGVRTIMAGIAGGDAVATAVTLCDRKPRVVAIVNLAPRQMMGVDSHGMLLACHDGLNNIVLTTVASPVPNGVEVG